MAKFITLFIGALAVGIALVIGGSLYMSSLIDAADLAGTAAGDAIFVFGAVALGIIMIVGSIMYFPAKILEEKESSRID